MRCLLAAGRFPPASCRFPLLFRVRHELSGDAGLDDHLVADGIFHEAASRPMDHKGRDHGRDHDGSPTSQAESTYSVADRRAIFLHRVDAHGGSLIVVLLAAFRRAERRCRPTRRRPLGMPDRQKILMARDRKPPPGAAKHLRRCSSTAGRAGGLGMGSRLNMNSAMMYAAAKSRVVTWAGTSCRST